MKALIAGLALICLLAAPVLSQEPYAIGDTVVDFTLRNHEGNWVSLSDYPNRIVFLVFWDPD